MLCLSEIQSPNALRTSIFRQVCGALFRMRKTTNSLIAYKFFEPIISQRSVESPLVEWQHSCGMTASISLLCSVFEEKVTAA